MITHHRIAQPLRRAESSPPPIRASHNTGERDLLVMADLGVGETEID